MLEGLTEDVEEVEAKQLTNKMEISIDRKSKIKPKISGAGKVQ